MPLSDNVLKQVALAIKAWARDEKANISIESYALELEAYKKLTGKDSVSSVLDVGFGAGWFLVSAVALGFADRGTGVDPAIAEHGTSIEQIKRTESLVRSLGLSDRVKFRIDYFESVLSSNEAEKYDVIIFRNSLDHMSEQQCDSSADAVLVERCVSDLAATRKLLNSQGHVYIVKVASPNRIYSVAYNLCRKAKGLGPINWQGKRTKNGWENILHQAGCANTASVAVRGNKWFQTQLLRYIRYPTASFLITGTSP